MQMIKYSVLLPTWNRLEYLRYAIETVVRQNYPLWEVIVSDNDSEDDIAGYIASLSDSRIRYFRTERLLPVTENWNNALSKSCGDYVVMLGDDDGLLPGYFERMSAVISEFSGADLVYTSGLHFAYPGVMPDDPLGFLRPVSNGLFDAEKPYLLDRQRAQTLAGGYLDFRMPMPSNMQYSLVSRKIIEKLSYKGQFFYSPYPDFYATPLLFLQAEKIVICPQPMVVVGITPKSYGFFHFNNRTQDGTNFLQNSASINDALLASEVRLPGTPYYDSWLLAVSALVENWKEAIEFQVNCSRYRLLQIAHVYKKYYFDSSLPRHALDELNSQLSFSEKWGLGLMLRCGLNLLRLMPQAFTQSLIPQLRRLIGHQTIRQDVGEQKYLANIVEVYEFIASTQR
jgi:glycosyltransferase involved in cell wall biosynthesis